MCRLFGCRSLEPDGVAHELLQGQNALRVQSREHPDGWGVAWYSSAVPHVVRSLSAAHADREFDRVGDFVRSPTVVAHVRKASVGGLSLENTHPFLLGRWTFVHNGTVPAWEKVRPHLEALLEPSLRRRLRGETDSERCFALFLTQLSRRADPEAAPFDAAARALCETVSWVRALTAQATPEPPATTFLLTDGAMLLACRHGRTLHCSSPSRDAQGRVAWFAVSSEDPHGAARAGGRRGPWLLLDEDDWVGVDGDLRVHRGRLDQAATP
jgi:glutamine amidotransferase